MTDQRETNASSGSARPQRQNIRLPNTLPPLRAVEMGIALFLHWISTKQGLQALFE